MALEGFKGKMVFSGGWGGGIWRERTRAFAKVGNFLRNFGRFSECLEWLGPNHNYFQKLRILLQFLPTCMDCGEIYKRNTGYDTKFMGYNGSGIVFQWKNPWIRSM
jgi:hypothetical protein